MSMRAAGDPGHDFGERGGKGDDDSGGANKWSDIMME